VKILIDIGHPAHVHIFKNLASIMEEKGHVFLFTVREGEKESELLNKLGFTYRILGSKRKGLLPKISGIFVFTFKIILISIRFKPDIFLSHSSMYAGYASFFLRKPHIALEDSGNIEQLRLSQPVSDVVLSPEVLPLDFGVKHIRYNGYHELTYLTPKYFSPDSSVLSLLGISDRSPYAIVRFVSWEASHDKGETGFTFEEKRKLINCLSKRLRVFISSERNLPSEFEPYKITLPFDLMHDFIAFATIYVGEGATMASEAGILGVPSFYLSSISRCYLEDQEKYGTVFNFTSFLGLLAKIEEVLSDPLSKQKHKYYAQKLMESKIDVTSFLVWFVENWPESYITMKENPSYQNRFA
jgi:predicted glycosyltransferase